MNLECSGVCQHPSTFWSVTMQPLGADQAAIWHMKGDIPSSHMRYGGLISIYRLHRKINFGPLTFLPLVSHKCRREVRECLWCTPWREDFYLRNAHARTATGNSKQRMTGAAPPLVGPLSSLTSILGGSTKTLAKCSGTPIFFLFSPAIVIVEETRSR